MEIGNKEVGSFIYVFNVADKDRMIAYGFTLLKADYQNNIYVFAVNPCLKFSDDIQMFYTNILTF